MGEMLDLDKMTGMPARLKKQTWQLWTSVFPCTNKRSWPRGCLSWNQRNKHMSHALVAHFIVLVSSKYALESESGRREVFIYSASHFVLGSFKKKRRDANRGDISVHCVNHAPSSSTSKAYFDPLLQRIGGKTGAETNLCGEMLGYILMLKDRTICIHK